MGFGIWGLGFGVWGLGFGVWGSGCGVWGLGLTFWAGTKGGGLLGQGTGFSVYEVSQHESRIRHRFGVQGLRFRGQVIGFIMHGVGCDVCTRRSPSTTCLHSLPWSAWHCGTTTSAASCTPAHLLARSIAGATYSIKGSPNVRIEAAPISGRPAQLFLPRCERLGHPGRESADVFPSHFQVGIPDVW